jgi:hypothetical protein
MPMCSTLPIRRSPLNSLAHQLQRCKTSNHMCRASVEISYEFHFASKVKTIASIREMRNTRRSIRREKIQNARVIRQVQSKSRDLLLTDDAPNPQTLDHSGVRGRTTCSSLVWNTQRRRQEDHEDSHPKRQDPQLFWRC